MLTNAGDVDIYNIESAKVKKGQVSEKAKYITRFDLEVSFNVLVSFGTRLTSTIEFWP